MHNQKIFTRADYFHHQDIFTRAENLVSKGIFAHICYWKYPYVIDLQGSPKFVICLLVIKNHNSYPLFNQHDFLGFCWVVIRTTLLWLMCNCLITYCPLRYPALFLIYVCYLLMCYLLIQFEILGVLSCFASFPGVKVLLFWNLCLLLMLTGWLIEVACIILFIIIF